LIIPPGKNGTYHNADNATYKQCTISYY